MEAWEDVHTMSRLRRSEYVLTVSSLGRAETYKDNLSRTCAWVKRSLILSLRLGVCNQPMNESWASEDTNVILRISYHTHLGIQRHNPPWYCTVPSLGFEKLTVLRLHQSRVRDRSRFFKDKFKRLSWPFFFKITLLTSFSSSTLIPIRSVWFQNSRFHSSHQALSFQNSSLKCDSNQVQ